MSNNWLTKFERPLHLEIQPSRLLLRVNGLIHGVALLAALAAPLPPLLRSVVIVSLVLHYIRTVSMRTVLSPVSAVRWSKHGGWRIADTTGHWHTVRPIWPVFVSYHAVVLRFRASDGSIRSVMLFTDSVRREDFRRLRVRLLHSASTNRCRHPLRG